MNEQIVTYKWAEGFPRPKGVSADEAQRELERIREIRGKLNANAVVEESRPVNSPLHSAFEWDDAVAAEHYRTGQGQQLIRAVVKIGTSVEPECRTWILVRQAGAEQTEYMPVALVVQDRDLLSDALDRLRGELRGAQHSVTEIQALAKSAETEPRVLRNLAKVEKHLSQAGKALGVEAGAN